MTSKKIWSMNCHEKYYDTSRGWDYLGSDKKHDYYVNHEYELVSIVFGPELNEYISGMYDYCVNPNDSGNFPEYPYTQLRKLVQGEAKKEFF